jgi:MFS family permease
VVDRHDRARVLMVVLVVQALAAAALGGASHLHLVSREVVLAVSVVLGCLRAFQMPANQAMLPQLVGMAVLPRALALSSGAMQASIIAGPAIGGFVYALGAAAVYSFSALGFALACLAMSRVRLRPVARSREPASWGTLLAGLAFIRQRPVLLGAMSLDLFAVLLGRCMHATSCTPARWHWACCARPRRWGRWPCRCCWRTCPSSAGRAIGCCWRWACTACR